MVSGLAMPGPTEGPPPGRLGAALARLAAGAAARGGPLALAVGLGGLLAVLLVQWPLPAMAAPLALAALVAVLRQPQWLLLAFFTSLAIPVQRSLAGLPVNAADGLLVLWCLLWPLLVRRPALRGVPWRLPLLVLAVAPFLGAVALSQLGSINPGASFKQMLRVLEWFVVLPLLLTVFAPDARFQRFAGAVLMGVPCLFALDGMVEYLNHGRSLSGMLGIPVPVPEGGENQIRHTFDVSGRAGSSFGGAQGLAMYLVMTLGFSIGHLLQPPRPWMRRLAVLGIVCSVGGLAVAQSRGGVMGAAAMGLAIALVRRPRWRLPLAVLALWGLGLALVVLGLLPHWDGTVAGLVPGGRPEAALDRLIIWGVVRDVAWAHPLRGVGLGNFRDAFFAREPWLHVALAYPSLHAHNTYLELLADTGLVGLLAYLAFLVAVARALLRRCRSGVPAPLTLAAIGSLAAYSVFAMVDMLLLQNMHLLLVLVLSLGLADARAPRLGLGLGVAAGSAPAAGQPPTPRPGDTPCA